MNDEASSQGVTFTGSLGEDLAGDLHLPAGEPRAFALFAHCFTCSKDSHAASRIANALAQEGFAVLRFDFTGLGNSEGAFADTTFGSNIEDLIAAAEWLEQEHQAPQLLIGHSLGGAAVIAAGAELDSVQAVATIGAPASPEHVLHLVTEADSAGATQDAPLDPDAAVSVDIGGRPFQIRPQFVTDLKTQPQCERLGALGKALMVMHAPMDQIVSVDQARIIYESARHPKSFVALDGADHLLSRRPDSVFAAKIIAAWADRYVGGPDHQAEVSQPASGDEEPGVLTVREATPDGFAHFAQVRHHRWVIDEPVSVGGEDSGPTPYEVLLSGLGACTSMTMRMYARRKGWEFGSTTVTVEHDRVHAKDCSECESSTGMVDHITRVITFAPEVTEEQRTALLVIADKCPVHRTLTNEIVVQTQVGGLKD